MAKLKKKGLNKYVILRAMFNKLSCQLFISILKSLTLKHTPAKRKISEKYALKEGNKRFQNLTVIVLNLNQHETIMRSVKTHCLSYNV